jgi:hypothetical protein
MFKICELHSEETTTVIGDKMAKMEMGITKSTEQHRSLILPISNLENLPLEPIQIAIILTTRYTSASIVYCRASTKGMG